MKNLKKELGDNVTYFPVPIDKYTNNKGITFEEECFKGNFSFGGSSFPAEELPISPIIYKDIPFNILNGKDVDNIELSNETNILVRAKKVEKVHFIGACCNGDFYTNVDIYQNHVHVGSDKLFFTDFLYSEPNYNDLPFFQFSCTHSKQGKYPHVKPTLWYNVIHLKEPTEITNILLYENLSMHIFALTLQYGEILK
ncbi:hypothetical protein J2S17_004862 [Cytobacillus purgationiresistens]|uniref:Uncharacterized protein n=2 Tax=Cytobacillus purgationiresistens TaxID=863449 RepID=A0ABU0ANU9_9BACI|nr:hypothetical protein [Cytobacillus purgationiresistens]